MIEFEQELVDEDALGSNLALCHKLHQHSLCAWPVCIYYDIDVCFLPVIFQVQTQVFGCKLSL